MFLLGSFLPTPRKNINNFSEKIEEVLKDITKSTGDQTELINEFGLLRNQFLGVLKALEAKQFQINNIVKLRVAGLEDSEINMFYGNPNK